MQVVLRPQLPGELLIQRKFVRDTMGRISVVFGEPRRSEVNRMFQKQARLCLRRARRLRVSRVSSPNLSPGPMGHDLAPRMPKGMMCLCPTQGCLLTEQLWSAPSPLEGRERRIFSMSMVLDPCVHTLVGDTMADEAATLSELGRVQEEKVQGRLEPSSCSVAASHSGLFAAVYRCSARFLSSCSYFYNHQFAPVDMPPPSPPMHTVHSHFHHALSFQPLPGTPTTPKGVGRNGRALLRAADELLLPFA